MDHVDALPARVRDERRRRRWTQGELAVKAGVSLGTVSNFENSKGNPQGSNLRSILRALDMEDRASGPVASETRSEWPAEVQVFLDVMGVYLTSMDESARLTVIHDITRQIVNGPPLGYEA